MRNINWTQCDLTGCRFSFCDFRDARLFQCRLDSMLVIDCNMKRVRAATPVGCAFVRVNFKGAYLGRSYNWGANGFTDCIREDGKFIRCGEDPWDNLSKVQWF
ncbi:MAG: pentapeptide repeat-containing protein [Xenococcaceae cyanobacterium]